MFLQKPHLCHQWLELGDGTVKASRSPADLSQAGWNFLGLGQIALNAFRHILGKCSHVLGEWLLLLIWGSVWMFDFAVGKEPGWGMQLLLGYVQTAVLTTRGVWVPSGIVGSRLTVNRHAAWPSFRLRYFYPTLLQSLFAGCQLTKVCSAIHLRGAWAAAKPEPSPVVQTG